MKHCYKSINFRRTALGIISNANNIINEYLADGFCLTVRQLYYQFIARDTLPEAWRDPHSGSKNNMKSYRKLDMFLGKARLAGLIDWSAIEDRTRRINYNTHWDDPGEIIRASAHSYALDSRSTQSHYIEVWIEKNALLGVIEPVCQKLDVTYLACIGYYSLSAMWRASTRLLAEDKKCIILHLGDHDPSGIDMTRDIQDRLNMFGCEVDVRRIALTMEQVNVLQPPPCPAKTSDSRFADYINTYGEDSWELDALSPDYIASLIKKNVDELTNKQARNKIIKQQESEREKLMELADNWED